MKTWTFPTTIYVGADSLERLSLWRGEQIFLVCDPFLAGTKDFQAMLGTLEKNNFVYVYTEVVPDPPLSSVVAGMNTMQQIQPTVVIAVGGGSAIDMTKAIVYFSKQLLQLHIKRFIAIPTTSGTGSEVTSFAVITDPEAGVKYPLYDDQVQPDEAILTPVFVRHAPPSITAYTGIDALVHALEAIVATGADVYTDAFAEKACALIFKHLPICYSHRATDATRLAMHEGSCLAGLAFTKAGVGICHAMAHQLGAHFHVPHGLANALLLVPVIQFNANQSLAVMERYGQLAITLGLAHISYSVQERFIALVQQVEQLLTSVYCPTRVQEVGIDEKEYRKLIPLMAKKAIQDMTYATNPYPASEEELQALLKQIV